VSNHTDRTGTTVKISDVQIGHRFRQDMGDLVPLAQSIKTLGLLQPILIDAHNGLVCGQRRLLACKELGWDTIEARVVDLDVLIAEQDENECRKQFTVSERVAIAKAIRDREKVEGKKAQQEGGKKAGRGRPKKGSAESAEANGRSHRESRTKAAAAVGMSHDTLGKAAEVVEAAAKDPEAYGDLAAEMDATGKVDPAHRKMRDRKKGKEPGQAQARTKREPPDLIDVVRGFTERARRWRDDLEKMLPYLDYIDKEPTVARRWREVAAALAEKLFAFLDDETATKIFGSPIRRGGGRHPKDKK
jgi:ParB-like chromosome segregation protein Spo0J